MLHVTPTIIIPDHELDERFVRVGPRTERQQGLDRRGLRFRVFASSLPDYVKARLMCSRARG
jgi:hypothetical protein